MTRGRTTAYALVLALLACALGFLGLTSAAQAASNVAIRINEGGTVPATTTVTAGDTVYFKNTATNGSFSVSGPGISTGVLAPGKSSARTAPLKAGTISYTVTLSGLLPLQSGAGSIVVKAAPTTTAPAPSPSTPRAPAPAPAPSGPTVTTNPTQPGAPVVPAPGAVLPPGPLTTAGTVPAPVNTGGNGIALQPQLGSGVIPVAPGVPGGQGLQPQLAPDGTIASGFPGAGTFPTTDPGVGTLAQEGVPSTQAQPQAGGTLTDRLNDPSELRRYGLPAVVGIVLLAGAFSLILRVLFATTDLQDFLRGDLPIHRSV